MTDKRIDLPGVNIIAALHFNCTIMVIAALLCVITIMVTCTEYTALSMYLYMHLHIDESCTDTKSHGI